MRLNLLKSIIFLIIIFSASHITAQTYVGIHAGLNMSKLSGDTPNNAKYGSLMGANIAAIVDIKLKKAIYLSFQPTYSQEGTKISYTVKGIEEPVDSIKIRLNYFSLPILVKITSTKERFYALAGIETSILLNSHMSSHDIENDITTKVSDLNVSIQFGAGFKIPLGLPILFIELRYAQGLLNLTEESADNELIPRIKTSGFKALVGIEIPISKSKK